MNRGKSRGDRAIDCLYADFFLNAGRFSGIRTACARRRTAEYATPRSSFLLRYQHTLLQLRLPVETIINKIKRLSHCPNRPKSWHEPCMKDSKRNRAGALF
jgi:hypothetical protein